MLDLNACQLLFRGKMRYVYQHPEFDDLLIKVVRPDRIGPHGELLGLKKKKRLQFFRTYGLYLSFVRELDERLRVARWSLVRPGADYPFARAHGLVQTNLGLGLVVDKISSPDGSPAPTASRLLTEGRFGPVQRQRLDAFFESCARNHFVLGDIHLANLVYEERNGGRFVCVDGAGEKSLVRVHEWSALLNRIRLWRVRRRIDADIARRSTPKTSVRHVPQPG